MDRRENPDLGDLLSQLCEGGLQANGAQELGDRLRDDPSARQEYLDYLLVHGLLHWDHSACQPAGCNPGDLTAPDVALCDTAPASGSAPLPPAESLTGASQSPILGFLSGLVQRDWTAGQLSPWMLLVVALGSSLLTALALQLPARNPSRPIAPAPSAAAPAPVASAPTVGDQQRPARASTTEFVATLVGAADARWADSAGPADGERLPAGEVRLTEGLAEFVFDGGAKVVLQGPARFVPQSSRGGLLHYGRLVAQVPPDAPRFTVQTAMAIVTVRDGEFAIEAGQSGATRLHVYSGLADVAGRSSHSSEIPHSRVAAGEALLIEAAADASFQELMPQGEQFVRALPNRQRHFPAGLVSYWNFDEQGGPALDLQGHNHGLLQGIKRTTGLIGKGALQFTDEHGQQATIAAEGADYVFTSGITVETLLVSRWDGALLNYDEIFRKEDGDQRLLLSLQYDDDVNRYALPTVPAQPVLSFGLKLAGKYSELDMPLDGAEGRPTLAQLTDGRPHHVVATYDAASGEKSIYFDGTLRYRWQYPADTQIVSGGSTPATIGSLCGWETFTGVIDEVALYNRALSAAEVADHWAKVQRGSGYFELESRPDEVDDF